MARVTVVKRAQQRYATKPVLDENGVQKQVPVMRNGAQKTTKRGAPVFLKLTERDLTRPKPMPTCGKCGVTIEVGQLYKWIEPHGRGQLVRCASCPSWQHWEYSSSLSARISQLQHDHDPSNVDLNEPGDMSTWASDAGTAIRELSEEKRESASNMEEGFGHETSASAELADIADSLEGWADEVEGIDDLELPSPEEVDCDECGGTGTVEASDGEADGHKAVEESCDECSGNGTVEGDEPTEEQMDEWREQAREVMQELLDNCPV